MASLDPQLLVRHVDRLHRAAWALCGSREDAEDLVQETFARVLAKPRDLREEDGLGYLMRTLRNTFVSSRRTAARRPRTVAELDDNVAADPSTSARPEEALGVHELLDAIAVLPDEFRLALVAVDIVGLSYREAAEALDTREATVATRVFRARDRVADAIRAEADPGAREVPQPKRRPT